MTRPEAPAEGSLAAALLQLTVLAERVGALEREAGFQERSPERATSGEAND